MFLYVFNDHDASKLMERGLALVCHDARSDIYIFEHPPEDFDISCPHVFSNSMSFEW